VKTFSQIGKSKLYLLSTLSEPDQQKITSENDVQSMTVKELEQQIKELKDINEHLEEDIEDRDHELRKVKGTLKDIDDQNIELRNEINELRSRPIDVAVAEPSEDVRQLKQTIKSLEISTEQQMKQMEEEHVADIRELHEKNRVETQKQLDDQKAEYEEKLRQAAVPQQQDDKEAFKAYFAAAYDSFSRMIDFAKESENKDFFRGKIGNMVNAFRERNERM
jgi:chromosome segregation ATPase